MLIIEKGEIEIMEREDKSEESQREESEGGQKDEDTNTKIQGM